MRVRRARAAELTAQLWAVSPEVAPPLRPPRQWRPHDCAHQRIIASRDISADTPPARGRGGGRPHCHRSGSLEPPGLGAALQHHATRVERPFSLGSIGPPGAQCHPQAGPFWREALSRLRWLDTKRACCPPSPAPRFPPRQPRATAEHNAPERAPLPGNFSTLLPTQEAL